MFTYKVIEENENKLESIIEKSGVTTKFTIQQVLDHLEYTKKALKEANGQITVNDTQDKMTLEILPMLKEIPEDKWQLVMSYSGRQVARPEILSLIETSEETIKSYTEQLEVITKECGIELPETKDGK